MKLLVRRGSEDEPHDKLVCSIVLEQQNKKDMSAKYTTVHMLQTMS